MQQLQLLANHFDLTTNLQIDHDNGIMGHQGMKLYLSGDFTFLKNKSDKIKKHFDDLIQISKSEANVDRVSEVTHIKGFKYVPEYVYDVETESGKAQLGTMVSKNTQLTMQTFHTGGAAKKGGTDIQGSFPRILELVKVPEKLSGKATLSSKDGKVESVEQNEIGGYDVKVGGTNFIIGPGRTPVVEKGNNVKKGDRLSDGKIKPQELAEFKDFASAQDYIVDGISDVYGGDYFKKGMETVVRGISDNAEITYAPENSGLLRGDKKSTSYIKSVNRERASQDLEPIGFKPYFKSVDTLNVDNEDWGTRITTNRIKDGLAKGMARGDWANLAGKDPVLPFLYGDDFGRPERKIKDGSKGFY